MIAIIDYRAGNLTSVAWAFEALGETAAVTRDPDEILNAERVVFPGVGAAGAAMESLRQLGLDSVIRDVVQRGTPFLGICVGTQILFERSDEDGGVECLGLIPGDVRLFRPTDRRDKVPQMGWNNVRARSAHRVLDGIEEGTEFYFVHSYYPCAAEPETIIAETDYAGVSFPSIVGRDNVVATQFHAEKSGRPGLHLLRNFAHWDGQPNGPSAC